MKYLLLDANIIAGYYLPKSLHKASKKALRDIERIINYARTHQDEYTLCVLDICIAEVLSVFMKYSFSRWNRHVRKTLDSRIFDKLARQFRNDINNGAIKHCKLSGRHIVGADLIAPIDHYYRISKGRNVYPMGTLDHLIISMGIYLTSIHGRDNVCILSADKRLTDILKKCKKHIPQSVISKLRLKEKSDVLMAAFGPDIFPKHINIKEADRKQYLSIFNEWPLKELDTNKHKIYRYLKNDEKINILIEDIFNNYSFKLKTITIDSILAA